MADIHRAAKNGDLSALRVAIKRGEDVNSVNEDGWTPLISAAFNGHTNCIRELLSSGAVVDLANKDGVTPLMVAAGKGHTDCTRELLSSGSVVDLANEDGVTPLMVAAGKGHTDCTRELLSSGSVVDLANEDGITSLLVAADEGHTDCVIQLLSSGAVVDLADEDGETPLYWAAREGHAGCVKELLSSGAVVDQADEDGWTPLMVAALKGHTDSVRQLLSSGAVVDLANEDGQTPLHWAANEGHTDCVIQLLSSGAVVDLANKNGWTPLMMAASEGHTDSVRQLLSSGAVVDLADKDGQTPLIVAARKGHTDTVIQLLSSGAVVDLADEDGWTPLMWAAYGGHTDCTRELLSSGAVVDLADKDGETALMVAKESEYSNPSIIKLLEEATESHSRPQSVPVLPRNWTVATDTETKKPVYQNKAAGETVSTPPGYPLHQTSAHPDVTFYDKPQEKEFTSSGGYADFDNGVHVTVPANAVPAGTSVGIKVQPSLASKEVFVMPEGIQSASPSYLISGEGLNGEVTLSMEHHVRVSTQQEADDLLFLQADSSPKRSGSHSVYEYQKIPEGRSEFSPGGNTGRLTLGTRLKNFFKIGRKNRGKTDSNLYTVRVYRSPLQTTEDRIAIIVVSLCGSLYAKFLETLDTVLIPRDYPEVSSKSIDRTSQGPLTFVDMCATLNIPPVLGWSVELDKELILRSGVDQPEVENFRPEDLHDYPPRIICRLFPEKNAPKRTTCTISLSGLLPQVKVHLSLKIPTPKVAVDTTKLQEATDELRRSALAVSDTQLGSTVKSVVSLMERMTAALRSSSLSELTAHTDSIRTEIASVLVVTRRVVEECTVQSISENMGASLSKIETLSHQLCHVAKVKIRYCLGTDQSEETAALVDLVENGANLLRAVDCLLRDIHTLSGVSGPSAKRVTLQELVEQYNLTDEQLNSEIEVPDTPELALCFDDVELYSSAMGLAIAEQADVNQSRGTQAAMMKCLQIWKQHNPSQATYRALLDIALRLGKGDTAHQICQQLTQRGVRGVVTGSDCIQVEAGVARKVPTVASTVVDINEATEVLRRTVGEMTTSQLGSTVETVLSLMEKITAALQSSSLSELTAHTDSIRTNVRSIRRLARKIVKECNIGASLSKMETLSHQLGRLAEDKLEDCQGLAESVQTLPRTIDGNLT
ncbi:uncharacterized protein LOC135334123 isoform X3 [Halichondria panicea]|uniref:uncharacterized protein LOC135334123 isoform X3 n=1 Tax=Halichondria panicea TaxID=6063 RepID=UPI00312B2E40